jgi:hypothetical protein
MRRSGNGQATRFRARSRWPVKCSGVWSRARFWASLPLLVVALALLAGCREVRVHTLSVGTTSVLGSGNQIEVVRNARALEALGIHAPVNFRSEFGVVLLMGPHDRTGYKQIVVRASTCRRRRAVAELSDVHALDRTESRLSQRSARRSRNTQRRSGRHDLSSLGTLREPMLGPIPF